MSKDIVVSGVTTHIGESYPTRNAGRGNEEAHDVDDDASEENPSKKRVERQRVKETRTGAPVEIERIKWIKRPRGATKIVDCTRLSGIIERILFSRRTLYDPLYTVLLEHLKAERFDLVEAFRVIATGTVPGRRKELGIFIKVMASGHEFVLPDSFLTSCQPAFQRMR